MYSTIIVLLNGQVRVPDLYISMKAFMFLTSVFFNKAKVSCIFLGSNIPFKWASSLRLLKMFSLVSVPAKIEADTIAAARNHCSKSACTACGVCGPIHKSVSSLMAVAYPRKRLAGQPPVSDPNRAQTTLQRFFSSTRLTNVSSMFQHELFSSVHKSCKPHAASSTNKRNVSVSGSGSANFDFLLNSVCGVHNEPPTKCEIGRFPWGWSSLPYRSRHDFPGWNEHVGEDAVAVNIASPFSSMKSFILMKWASAWGIEHRSFPCLLLGGRICAI